MPLFGNTLAQQKSVIYLQWEGELWVAAHQGLLRFFTISWYFWEARSAWGNAFAQVLEVELSCGHNRRRHYSVLTRLMLILLRAGRSHTFGSCVGFLSGIFRKSSPAKYQIPTWLGDVFFLQ